MENRGFKESGIFKEGERCGCLDGKELLENGCTGFLSYAAEEGGGLDLLRTYVGSGMKRPKVIERTRGCPPGICPKKKNRLKKNR